MQIASALATSPASSFTLNCLLNFSSTRLLRASSRRCSCSASSALPTVARSRLNVWNHASGTATVLPRRWISAQCWLASLTAGSTERQLEKG
jgi:hypothetical protein